MLLIVDLLWHLLLALAAVVFTGRLLGTLFRFIGQPPVIGEVVAGILLGPSFLGAISHDTYTFVLPASVAPGLGLIAQLGVVLYMFLVGVELDTEGLKGQLRSTVGIALTSIVVPFALGVWLATRIYQDLAPTGVPFIHFMLFLGVAMSITAFPVLARILADQRMTKTHGVVSAGVHRRRRAESRGKCSHDLHPGACVHRLHVRRGQTAGGQILPALGG
jgi:Kef-type K+ transport system membrane component KefB